MAGALGSLRKPGNTGTIGATIQWLSRVLAGFSVFKLAHAWWQFGLAAPIEKLTTFYDRVAQQVLGPLVDAAKAMGLQLPAGWREFAVLYLLIGFALLRRAHAGAEQDDVFWRLSVRDRFDGLSNDLLGNFASKLRLNWFWATLFAILWPLYPLFLVLMSFIGVWSADVSEGRAEALKQKATAYRVLSFWLWSWELALATVGAAIVLIINAGL